MGAPPVPKAAAKDAGSVTVVTISEPGSCGSGGNAAPGSPAPGGAAAAAAVPAASYFKLYSGADRLNWLLMVLGTVGGLGNGIMLPLFTVVFGDFTNVFGTYLPPCLGFPPIPGFMTEAEFNRAVSDIALKFLYLESF